tara:strand:- start:63 stop:536 length:474 start_codon:yes stop_codon:yes gene_type:complete
MTNKEVEGFPNYLIYNDGRVWSKSSQMFRKCYKNPKGYIQVSLNKNGKVHTARINRLLAIAFIPNPENKSDVDHINDIRDDNRLENLQWLTHQENINKRSYINKLDEKFISISTIKKNNKIYYSYRIKKNNCFEKHLSCKDYTLEDAIMLRDSLLSM